MVLVDGGEPMSEQDLRITSMVVEAGRALVLAINKWDLVDEERRRYLEREIERDLAPVAWAPRVNVSARTGRRSGQAGPGDRRRARRLGDARPDRAAQPVPGELVAAHPHPLRGGKQPRILFGTQAASRPPTFVLFTTGFLEAGYRRFVERRLREEFGFVGTPIRINAADPGEARAGPLTQRDTGRIVGRSDGPRDLPGQREQSAHEPVATVRGLAEHQRAPAVDDGDPGRAAQFGRFVGDASRRRRPDASRRGRPPAR